MSSPTAPTTAGKPDLAAKVGNKTAIGCAVLFLLPFAAAGTFTGARAVGLLRVGNWREAVLYVLFALVFGGVGFGGLAGIRIAYGKLKDEEELKASHPGEPWLWRRSWASRRLEDSSRDEVLGAWIFAALWNLVSIPSAYLGTRAALYEGKTGAFAVLLFPLAGIWLLARAIQATMRSRKYGISRFELSTLPGIVGHTLAGTLRVGMDQLPEGDFQVELTCVRLTTTRSGKSSSTSEKILWQESCQVRGQQIRDYSGMGIVIPVSFRLPVDAEPWDATDPNNRVIWRLHASASVPGIDYDASFEVPVFRTAASEGPPTPEDERVTSLATPPYRQRADSPIVVTTTGRGTEILFPAARNIGAAVSLTFFMILWWGALGVQLYFRIPVIFPIVTALFGLLIAAGAFDLWLKVSRVTAGSGAVIVASGYLHPGQERRLAAADIADVIPAIGMQAGKTPYYDVQIRLKNGKKVTAGRSVRDKREAEWLAATIRKALGG
ncbi:MAG: hypothetical protein ACJ8BF_05115 [Gemmatimonadales bacterium]